MTAHYVFEIDPSEHARVNEFVSKHQHSQKCAIGGNLSYTFCSTSIGWVVSVKCSDCGITIDASGDL